jgi:hypothetical protein
LSEGRFNSEFDSATVSHYLKHRSTTEKIAVVDVFCDYNSRLSQTLEFHHRSILEQLVDQQAVVSPEVRNLIIRCKKENEIFDEEGFGKAIMSELKAFDLVFFLIDALDECDEYRRQDFFRFAHCEGVTIRFIVASRHLPPKDFSVSFITMSIEAHHDDMEAVLKERLLSKKPLSKYPELHDKIISTMLQRCQNM